MNNEGMWGVRDRNATEIEGKNQDGTIRYRVRPHEIRPGVVYELSFREPKMMPEGDARIFLKDSAFIVTDEMGRTVAPLSVTAQSRVLPGQLEANMVLADLNELTDEALLTRAAQLPDGHRLNSETSRERLVHFIVAAHTMKGRQKAGRAAPTDAEQEADGAGDAEDLDDDAVLTKLLAGG